MKPTQASPGNMSNKDQYITDRLQAAAPIAATCVRIGFTLKESAENAAWITMKMEQIFTTEFYKNASNETS